MFLASQYGITSTNMIGKWVAIPLLAHQVYCVNDKILFKIHNSN